MRRANPALVACILLALAPAAHAQTPALTSFTGTQAFSSIDATDLTIGWSFTANAAVNVTSLGVNDLTPADPLAQSHQVGIWSSTGTLLGSTVVQTNSPLIGSFRYASVTPFSLAAGQTYFLGEAITNPYSDLYVYDSGTVVTDAAITFGSPASSNTASGFGFPSNLSTSLGNVGRIGPNFQFVSAAVPEPGSVALLIGFTSSAGLLARRRKRARQAA